MSADESEDKFSVLDAPSIGSDPNANPNAFKIPLNNFYQTVTPSGTITKDQVFATATTDEVVPPDAVAQYAVYLNTTNKVKPVKNLTPEEFSINQRYIEQAATARKRALDAIAGTQFSEAKLATISKEPPFKGSANDTAIQAALSAQAKAAVLRSKIEPPAPGTETVEQMVIVNQQLKDIVAKAESDAAALSKAAGLPPNSYQKPEALTNNDQPNPFDPDFDPGTTSPKIVSKDFASQPPDEGVYAYIPSELYADRYDFETGKKIRVGVAGGTHGGAGDRTTQGDTIQTVEQSEPFPSGPQ